MRLIIALVILAQPSFALSVQAKASVNHVTQPTIDAGSALAEMRQMVGLWKPADKPQSPLRIRFYLTADDTVLVESWEVRGQPHSLTLYHLDGASLLATHYCPQGNQPRLRLMGRDASGLHFALRDVTDLDPASETHQHDLWIDLANPGMPVRSEIYASTEGIGVQERLPLVRADQE